MLNIFIAIIEEAYVNQKMQNKSHWIFDYIRKDKTHHNIQVKEDNLIANKTDKHARNRLRHSSSKDLVSKINLNTAPGRKNMFASSVKNNSSFVTGSPMDHYRRPEMGIIQKSENFEQNKYERVLEEEFNNIDKKLEELRIMSIEIISSGDAMTIDELRTFFFDQINIVASRTQEIRTILNKA